IVIDGDMRWFMPRKRQNNQFPCTQIESGLALRPMGQTEKILHSRQVMLNHGRLRVAVKLVIPEHMIFMAMSMRDDQIDRLQRPCCQPSRNDRVDGLADRESRADAAGAG